nr:MAG TPA: hypothetical protein [Caudoviricetes sp.]
MLVFPVSVYQGIYEARKGIIAPSVEATPYASLKSSSFRFDGATST